jgi:hypothetical protein
MQMGSTQVDRANAVGHSPSYLPEANPGIYLTASLGVTLPFNLVVGLPLYYGYARWLTGG